MLTWLIFGGPVIINKALSIHVDCSIYIYQSTFSCLQKVNVLLEYIDLW